MIGPSHIDAALSTSTQPCARFMLKAVLSCASTRYAKTREFDFVQRAIGNGRSMRLLLLCTGCLFGAVCVVKSRLSVFPWLGRRLSADGERATQLRNEGPFSTYCTTLEYAKNLRDDSERTVQIRLEKLRKIRVQ